MTILSISILKRMSVWQGYSNIILIVNEFFRKSGIQKKLRSSPAAHFLFLMRFRNVPVPLPL